MLLLGCAAERDATSKACCCGTRLIVPNVGPSWNNVSSSAETKEVDKKYREHLKDLEAAAWEVDINQVIRRSCSHRVQLQTGHPVSHTDSSSMTNEKILVTCSKQMHPWLSNWLRLGLQQ